MFRANWTNRNISRKGALAGFTLVEVLVVAAEVAEFDAAGEAQVRPARELRRRVAASNTPDILWC